MDYSRIRGMESGQRLAFEELICQLAHLDRPAAYAEFRRIEGAGGDGGIEAYWLLKDTSEIGYQAKYYLKSSEIDWANIDESVKQALTIHPSLTKYVIAIPCDLTDKTGRKGGGMTGWEHWATHKAKWESLAPKGKQVEFVPWPASTITERLIRANAEGLRNFWFGDVELSECWFREKIELSVKSLEERYHPEDHVEVRIEKLFKAALHDESVASEIRSQIAKLCDAISLEKVERNLGEKAIPIAINIRESAKSLEKLALDITTDPWRPWPIAECTESATEISKQLSQLWNAKWESDASKEKPKNGHDQDSSDLEYRLGRIGGEVDSLLSLLGGQYFDGENSRTILLYGRAGTGKSHLLGNIAQRAVSEGRRAILILGQHLSGGNLWKQITSRLELGDITSDVFLKTLSAACEATGKRGLLLVDAINEGAGRRLWNAELAEFITKVEKYRNLVLVISCRTEYMKNIIPEPVLDRLPSFEVRGFETAGEQARAARIYLSKRGISQPNSPWLSEEFVNPLFLRSACIALQKDKKTSFPLGLNGTRDVFIFYLKSIARNLGVGQDGTETLVPPTIQALGAIALDMADKRRDYVPQNQAIQIVGQRFEGHPAPTGTNWLEVLQRNGLFRVDPGQQSDGGNLFDYPEDIIRFSFQRLQDHLMADALLKEVQDPSAALENGSLSFIHDGDQLDWEWTGLVEALSIQLPERFNRELLDLLPGDINTWANDYEVRESFIESLKWRNSSAFTERTFEIYEALQNYFNNYFDIIIQLSTIPDHPFNAQFTHKKLLSMKIAERDSFWTRQINDLSLDEGSITRRLIDWSALEQSEDAAPNIQYLCAITLTWFTSSTCRELRDKATKALTSLLRHNLSLYKELSEAFQTVDDLYVVERLHTAAYGACCIDPSKDRLPIFAEVAYRSVFDRDVVPLSIHLRDSALGIIELAKFHESLPTSIDIQHARPPYGTKPIRLTVTEDSLKKVVEKAGDSQISHSCTGWIGDFANYEIQPRVGSFLNISLRKPEPLSADELYERFEEDVINHCQERSEILRMMHSFRDNPFRMLLGHKDAEESKEYKTLFKRCEALLFLLLTPAEKRRYTKEYKPRFDASAGRHDRQPHVDAKAAQFWVAKRAYGYGWTTKRFPHDQSFRHQHGRERPAGERIGKKYQWLALDELLCSLADNNWMSESAYHGSRQYSGPLDIGFHRDIDPTVLLPDEARRVPKLSIPKHEISMRDTSEAELSKWPFGEDPSVNMKNLIAREDSERRKWVVLNEHRSVSEYYKDKAKREHGLRKQEWRFLLPIVVRQKDEKRLIEYLLAKHDIEVNDWSTRGATNSAFLLEAPWRSTWDQEQWSRMEFRDIGEVEIAYPCYQYYWESHCDSSLPDGAQALLPAPWLAHRLGLKVDADNPSVYLDSAGTPCFVSGKSRDDGSHAFIDGKIFDAFLKEDSLSCVWVFVAERGAWPGGGNSHASWRRSEGFVWLKRGKPQMHHWNDDTDKGELRDSSSPGLVPTVSAPIDEPND
ncbi:ATP-binding protein [Pseudomonas sp. Root562]|uniref:ATP-binding protein n=1 Tax=Pseudomonas sp. Root562 TaxID=1736561 RepID=UPI000A9A08DF|nr:ATP-binding protein [Pseudomonas sp. Root562]